MAMRTVENWIHVFKNRKTTTDMAHQIIGDLTGYRSSSVYREEDTQSLRNAIEAIMQMNSKPS